MIKMHLAATPANEGARRLAWWIGETFGGDVAKATDRTGLGEATVERLLDGTVVPGTDIALPIGLASAGFILRRDWQRPSEAGWFDRPSARPSIAELVLPA